MPTPDIEFDPNGSLENWDWLKPEDLELFAVSSEEFERQQDEFWQRGDRLDARRGLVKKKQRVQGEKGIFERTYWVKPNIPVPTNTKTPRDIQAQQHIALNSELKKLPLLKTAAPEMVSRIDNLSLGMKRLLLSSINKEAGEIVDVNTGLSFVTIKADGGLISLGERMGQRISFTTGKDGHVMFTVNEGIKAQKGLQEKDIFEKTRDKKVTDTIKGAWRSQIAQMEDGKTLFCSPARGDGRGGRRGNIYKGMGFSESYEAIVDKKARRGVRPIEVENEVEYETTPPFPDQGFINALVSGSGRMDPVIGLDVRAEMLRALMNSSTRNTDSAAIAEKYGFAKGVASDAYLVAFDSAAAICDRRYGWKKGAGGKCERVTPQDDSRKEMVDYYNEATDAADEGRYKNSFGTDSYIPLGTQKFIQSKTINEDDVAKLLDSRTLSKAQKVDMLHDVAAGDMLSDEARAEALSHWTITAKTGKPPLNAFGTTDFISSARKGDRIVQNSEEYDMRYWGVPYTKKQAEGMHDWEFDIEDLGWSNFIRYQRDSLRANTSVDWGRYKAGNRGIESMEGDLVGWYYKPESSPIRRKDSLRQDANGKSICDRRYGWKKGAGGKCERIKPQKATMQQGDRPQGGSNRTMLTIGLGALATGVVGGAIGGTILANNAAQKQFDLERQELQETYKKNSDKQVNDFREKHEAQKSALEKDLSEAESRSRDLEEAAKQDRGKLEDLQKRLIEIKQNHKTVASERDQAIADLDKANKAIAEKESVIESLSKGSEGIADIEEKMKAAQQELEAERSKTATLQATAKEKEDAFKEASQKLEEAQNTIKATGEAYATAKSEAEKEKKRFNELSQAIDKDSKDVKDLTKKVEALKVAQKKAQENGEELAIAKEKISDLELTQRNLNDRILSVQTEKELKISELQEKAKELEDLRATTTVGIGDRDQQISQLQSSLNEGARTVAKLRQSEAEAKSKLKESEQLLIQEQKKANAVQSALNKQEKQAIALEKELGITRKEAEQQIEAIHRKHQAEVAKLYEDKAQILSASPETFNRKKLRRSSDAQLSGVLSYSIEDGISQDDLQPGSRFWAAKDATKEKAVVKAAERIIELEEERIQANVAKKVAQQIKETPLAMSVIGGEKQVANMRKRSADLATATALTRSIADPTTLVESDKGLPMNRKQTWRSMASDIWDPRSEGSPTPQLLENEALLAEAKLRDVYVFSQSKAIRRQAQESYKEVLSSDLPPEQKAEQFKSIHQAMMQAIKQMETTATGSQDNLFAAIKRDIEGRKDSRKVKFDAKEKGKKAAEEKIARVMGEFKDGKLKSSSGSKVKNRKQAIAIALSEAKRQYATPKP